MRDHRGGIRARERGRRTNAGEPQIRVRGSGPVLAGHEIHGGRRESDELTVGAQGDGRGGHETAIAGDGGPSRGVGDQRQRSRGAIPQERVPLAVRVDLSGDDVSRVRLEKRMLHIGSDRDEPDVGHCGPLARRSFPDQQA